MAIRDDEFGDLSYYEQFSTDELLAERKIVIRGMIGQKNTPDVLAQLLYLRHMNSRAPITLLVDSCGGIVDDCLAIYDFVRSFQTPFRTHCLGRAGGGAVLIVAAGTKRFRSARQTSTFAFATSIDARTPLDSKELVMMDALLVDDLYRVTGIDQSILMELSMRLATITATEAQQLGIIDRVVP